jgi:predicted nucleic acid-binding protein
LPAAPGLFPALVFCRKATLQKHGFRAFSEEAPLASRAASNLVGDCYLLAFAKSAQATLVTFDKAVLELAGKQGHTAVNPG